MPLGAIGFALGFGTAATSTAAIIAGGVTVGLAAYGVSSVIQGGQKTEKETSVTAPPDIGKLTPDEAQIASSKRLARIGKYFTSPTGDNSVLSAGSQKVFS